MTYELGKPPSLRKLLTLYTRLTLHTPYFPYTQSDSSLYYTASLELKIESPNHILSKSVSSESAVRNSVIRGVSAQ